MALLSLSHAIRIGALLVALPTSIYIGILGLLIASTSLQNNVFYLHRVTLTAFDLNQPEMFGFMPQQVASFFIDTADGEKLHAWHILPLGLYRRKQDALLEKPSSSTDERGSSPLNLLRDDPEARLVIYLHGTSGTVGSGFRPASYRALSALSPDKIHVLAIEYRGYGLSSGTPSEEGLLADAIAATEWATEFAGIPSSRIVIFGQSLGTAVGISLVTHFTKQISPVDFAGLVLVASFTDVATLTRTYRIGGVLPVLSPLKSVPRLFAYFTGFLQSTWLSKDRIAEFVKVCEQRRIQYHVTLVHAEDDPDIPFVHTDELYWHAVNASKLVGTRSDNFELHKEVKITNLDGYGRKFDWTAPSGVIKKIVLKYGNHDRLMSYPVSSLAVLKAFQSTDATFAA